MIPKSVSLASACFFTLSLTARAETFSVDVGASTVGWKAGKKIGSFHTGDIKIKSGQIQTDAKGAVKSAQVSVDMKTIANHDLKEMPSMQTKLVGHLSSDDFFKVEQFPESSFTLTKIAAKTGSKDEFTVTGDLTLIGKSVPITFPAKIAVNQGQVGVQATLTVERLKWGLQYGSGSIFKTLTADKIINDSFELTLNLVATK